jgi:pimeloyl-ACP methyl ester carboxylesterase
MPRAHVRDLDIEYETFGQQSDPALLLVMGLAYQMIEWEEQVCRLLAARRFWVIRFDNRDVGLSTKLDQSGTPDFLGGMLGNSKPSYTLDDMADDAVGLLDVLGIPAAHVVGISMGGMIAQLMAINHGGRVLSLTSIMSTVGGSGVVQPNPEVLVAMLTPPGPNRDERIERSFALRRLINGRGVPFDEERARRMATRAVDRSFYLDGAMRQMMAIIAAPDRTPALRRLTMPTLVIQGESDPLVPPDNGRQTAAAIRDARLMMIPAMGHHLPERVWTDIIDAITELAAAATPPHHRDGRPSPSSNTR